VSERVSGLPDVERVGIINHLPLSGYNWVMDFIPDPGAAASGSAPPRVGWRMVDGEYFGAMRIPLRAGRLFTASDDTTAPLVILINETAARRFYGSPEKAVGRTAGLTGAMGDQRVQIAGVVGDVRHTSISIPPEPEIYRPVAQAFVMAMTMVVRTTGDPAAAGAAVRTALWSVDPNVALAGMAPAAAVVRDNLGRPRMLATLLLVFASVGVAIVICGVYGVVAYTVRRREREIGIRIALGAGRQAVRALILTQGAGYAAVGLAVGLPAALAVSRVMRGLLYGVEPHDPLTVVILSGAVALTTVLATLVPAARAARIEPAAIIKAD
jgi:predicted permease